VALIHRILWFIVSIVLIIIVLIGATASYSKEKITIEKLLSSLISEQDKFNFIINKNRTIANKEFKISY